MFWKIYTSLCAKVGKSPNAVAKEIGIASASVTYWKNGSQPRNVVLQKLSNYFNVPVEYFTEEGDQSTQGELSPIRQELYQKIQSLSEEQVERLILLLDSFEKRNQ